MEPAVSVVLPVRDGGPHLAAAVGSILAQENCDFELILVDDHSSDGALESLPSRDARIRFIANAGGGLIDALNTGLRAARGHYIARMDADDIALPKRLRTQLDYLARNPSVAIAGTEVELFAEGELGAGNQRYQRWINVLRSPGAIHRERFIECPLPHPTWLMPRSVVRRLGGYRDAGWPEDYDFLLRAASAGYRCGKPEGVLLRWRDHPDRASRIDPRYAQERFTAARAHFLAADELQGRPVVIWGAGPGGRDLHDALSRESVTVQGFVDVHPRRIGGCKRGRPVWHFEEAGRRAREAIILVAVGVPSARPEIRAVLQRMGRREGADWWFAA
ncbi:glycosyltransferase [Elongatibacter sediminis]|uniref:Glycosyltransferase n=1 Tax=Elongatibacter sediminis TaxID=3119006 RepID=A0AAW9RIH5_9GAMM